MRRFLLFKATTLVSTAIFVLSAVSSRGDADVYLTGTPDYEWHAGCFGTATGNLMGYWDRHGFTNFYSGPTGGGLAPLNSAGGNNGIRSLWASSTDYDGRPSNKPGHMEDYNVAYESTAPDPYVTAGRAEHTPDCIGDFIGLSQRKYSNQNGECDGNIDAYSFVYWDTNGNRRVNFSPTNGGGPTRDIQSGLREWTHWRGSEAEVFTQLVDYNPHIPAGRGFAYEDLKAEIDAGYPVLFFLQANSQFSRNLGAMPKANPAIHGVMAYGHLSRPAEGIGQGVRVRTSWGSGDDYIIEWGSLDPMGIAFAEGLPTFPVRGVIGYHPRPKILQVTRNGANVTLRWEGPASQLYDAIADHTTSAHTYQLQRATSLAPGNWKNQGSPTTNTVLTFSEAASENAFFRLRLLLPGENP